MSRRTLQSSSCLLRVGNRGVRYGGAIKEREGKMEISDYIEKIECQQKEQDAIYHNAALKFGLSDTAMWVLYMLDVLGEGCTQQELCQQSFFPKQTINTAITGLVQKGYVELCGIPGTRNQKRIIRTPAGKKFSQGTVAKLIQAELCAYGRLSEEELQIYLELSSRITIYLKEETDRL